MDGVLQASRRGCRNH